MSLTSVHRDLTKFLYNQWYLNRVIVRGFASVQVKNPTFKGEWTQWPITCVPEINRYVCDWLLCSALWKHFVNRIFWRFPERKHKCTGAFTKSVSPVSYYYSFNWRCFWLREKMDVWLNVNCVSLWICESWQPCVFNQIWLWSCIIYNVLIVDTACSRFHRQSPFTKSPGQLRFTAGRGSVRASESGPFPACPIPYKTSLLTLTIHKQW